MGSLFFLVRFLELCKLTLGLFALCVILILRLCLVRGVVEVLLPIKE